jgi:plastocyanin
MVKILLGVLLLLPAANCNDEVSTVGGMVKFDGPVPPAKLNKALGADPACCALHATLPTRDDLVVDKDGGVRWAFVYVKSGLALKEYAPPKEAVQIEQKGCIYTPHVAGVQVGQAVTFRNADPMLHNVHGLPFTNKEFNFGQSTGAVNPVKFAFPELPVKVKCDVHPWMATYLCVVDHPYFAVTDAAGKFELPKLPAGTYTLGVWHEGLQTLDGRNEIQVVVAGDQQVVFTMKKKGP